MSLGLVRPTRSRARVVAVATSITLLAGAVSACQASDEVGGAAASSADGSPEDTGAVDASGSEQEAVPAASVTTNPAPGTADVAVDTLVKVSAADGTLSKVRVTSPTGQLAGAMMADDTRWKAAERLEPGTTYDVVAVAAGADGATVREKSSFTTDALTLDEQTYPSVAPLAGETVGVGMPVVVSFDVPVTNRASFERHMSVSSTPQQKGSWHWLSDTEARWRPASYWKPGTEVSVDVNVNGVDAGQGIYGQEDRVVDFSVGDSHIYKVNAQTYQMEVFSNGSLLRTIPITTGKEGFTTRSGTKVIIEKFASKRMNSETIGINPDSAEGYDLDDVQYAMRVTYSGEFIHAAPWSVASQGSANVSHGCTGLSPENAKWLYDMTMRGDVVEYTGTDRPMTLDNGYGDWNESFGEYKSASALS